MNKTLFMNFSPNKNGNTNFIGEKLLKNIDHETLQIVDYKISQYGQVFEDDQISEVFKKIKDADTLVIGAPVYWYTVGGLLKTFIGRLYMLDEAQTLKEKKLYLFAQGSAPSKDTENSITYLATRLCYLMEMELKGVVVDSSDGGKILNTMTVE